MKDNQIDEIAKILKCRISEPSGDCKNRNIHIEEMARVIETTEQIARDAHCGYPSPRMYATDLYDHGCRKQSEGEWIVHTHHYECSKCGFEYETDVFAEDYNPITDFYLHFCSVCGVKMKGGEGK